MAIQTVDNKYGVAKWIVDPVLGRGTHTTVAAALTSASSGEDIFIRPGTYTEDLTLKAGVNLTGFTCDEGGVSVAAGIPAHVIIKGKMTATFTGGVVLSGLCLQTNGDFILATSGANATVINFITCFFDATNNSAFQLASSGAGAVLYIDTCWGNLSSAATNYFACTNGSSIFINSSQLLNGASSTTANTVASTGSCNMFESDLLSPITTSDSGGVVIAYCTMQTANVATITLAGTGSLTEYFCRLESGTASTISIGAGCSATLHGGSISTSNTNAVTGAGTLLYSDVIFPGSSEINTTTQTPFYDQLGKYRARGQPAFLAYVGTTITNVTGDGTQYTVIYDNEVFDQDANFNLGTSTFTAPVTGRYSFTSELLIVGGTNIGGGIFRIVTSNRTYQVISTVNISLATTSCINTISVLADMDATDTMTITILTTDTGGKIDDVSGTSGGDLRTWVSGHLAC